MQPRTRRKLQKVVEPQDELPSEAWVRIGDIPNGTHPFVSLVEVPSELPHEVDDDEGRGARNTLMAVNEYLATFQACFLDKIDCFIK